MAESVEARWLRTHWDADSFPNVDMDIEHFPIVATCLFGSNNIPILGRNTLLKAIDFGFDVNGWLLKF